MNISQMMSSKNPKRVNMVDALRINHNHWSTLFANLNYKKERNSLHFL